MAENPKLLMLRLEGVLQSWGESSKWDYRDSALMPTKSGIVGLIACAMGLERGNPEIDAIFDAITLAVRADRPGVRMTDYHTASGGCFYHFTIKKEGTQIRNLAKCPFLPPEGVYPGAAPPS